MRSEFDIIYKLERVLGDEELDGLVEFSQEHLVGVLDLFAIGVVIVFDLQFAHVEVGDDGMLINRFQVAFVYAIKRTLFPSLFVPQNDFANDILGS